MPPDHLDLLVSLDSTTRAFRFPTADSPSWSTLRTTILNRFHLLPSRSLSLSLPLGDDGAGDGWLTIDCDDEMRFLWDWIEERTKEGEKARVRAEVVQPPKPAGAPSAVALANDMLVTLCVGTHPNYRPLVLRRSDAALSSIAAFRSYVEENVSLLDNVYVGYEVHLVLEGGRKVLIEGEKGWETIGQRAVEEKGGKGVEGCAFFSCEDAVHNPARAPLSPKHEAMLAHLRAIPAGTTAQQLFGPPYASSAAGADAEEEGESRPSTPAPARAVTAAAGSPSSAQGRVDAFSPVSASTEPWSLAPPAAVDSEGDTSFTAEVETSPTLEERLESTLEMLRLADERLEAALARRAARKSGEGMGRAEGEKEGEKEEEEDE
ncbi:hypothetical protein JCM8097_007729 [Rhodosporidiobolus ruineniae]